MALYHVNFPKFSSYNGSGLGSATTEICAGFGIEGHPFLGSEVCCRADTVGVARCHGSAVDKGQLLGPWHL